MHTCEWVTDPEKKPQTACGAAAVVHLAVVGVVMPVWASGFFICAEHEDTAYDWSKSTYGADHIEGVDLRGD